MNSVNDIWAGIMDMLSATLTPTSINTWFAECTPVEVADGRLVIYTPSRFKRDIIQDRFAQTIKDSLSELFSAPFDLLILTGDELEDYKRDRESSSTLPEMDGYTFENFIVGPSNKFAHAAAISVTKSPGSKSHNPLFIYGHSGLGKTHLLLAIGAEIHSSDPDAKICYIKGDEFMNQMIKSIRENTTEEFRTKYRGSDLFLVDDIQFIAGKDSTQDEFFHTFNNIYENGKQIVITSDRPPREMALLEDRLRSRFEGGIMADIQPPDLETRIAIIRSKAAHLGIVLPDEVVDYIANNIVANIRQIEGVIKRLTAYHEVMEDKITVTTVKNAIKDVIRIGNYIPTPDVIIEETARFYSVSAEDIKGQRRSKNIAIARHVSIYLIRNLTNLSLNDIGALFEDRNHATVLSSVRKIEGMLETDNDMSKTIRDITSNINSRQR